MSGASEDRDRHRLVLVVGAGTSGGVLARILRQLGFHAPLPEAPVAGFDDEDAAAPAWLAGFHRRLLKGPGAPHADPAGELRSWLSVQLVGADATVVNEPRAARLLPLWRRCAHDLGVQDAYAIVVCDPAVTAGGPAAWLDAVLEAEHASRGARRAVVARDRLLADWPRELSRVGELLGLDELAQAGGASHAEIDALVERWGASLPGAVDDDAPPWLRKLAEDAWRNVSALAGPAADEAEAHAALDAIRAEYAEHLGGAVPSRAPAGAPARPRAGFARRMASHVRRPLPSRSRRRIPAQRRERLRVAAVDVVWALPVPVRRAVLLVGRRASRALRG